MLNFPRTLLLALLAVQAVGCGGGPDDLPEMAGVTGTVTMDGQPLEGAKVVFSPTEGPLQESWGMTDGDGKYELMFSRAVGAKVGEHKVKIMKREYAETSHDEAAGTGTVEKAAKAPKASGHGAQSGAASGDGGVELIDAEFNTSSGLIATVEGGKPNVFDYEVRGR